MSQRADSNAHHHQQKQYTSRWDSLPKNNYDKPTKRSGLIDRNDSRVCSQQLHNQKRSEDCFANTKERRNLRDDSRRNKTYPSSCTQDVVVQYRLLQGACCKLLDQNITSLTSESGKPLHDLLHFIRQHYNILPTEETAVNVVQEILLPTLLSVATHRQQHQQQHYDDILETKQDDNALIAVEIISVIQTLLLCSHQASAMLSPISHHVQDIDDVVSNSNSTFTNETISESKQNPIRIELWSVLQQCLPITSECFVNCIHATKRIDETLHDKSRNKKTITDNDNHLDLSVIIRYIKNSLTVDEANDNADPDKILSALNLLLALLQYPPTSKVISSSVSFIQSLLFPNYVHRLMQHNITIAHCTHCGWQRDINKSTFLQILHDPPSSIIGTISLKCTSELLRSMPLSLWLYGGGNNKPRKTSTFQQNLLDILTDFIHCALCKVHQLTEVNANCANDTSIAGISLFIKSALQCIPYNVDAPTMDTLAVTLVDFIMKQSLCYNFVTIYAPIIMECFRGHVTVSGPLQYTSIPIQTWFQHNGQTYLEQILLKIIQNVLSADSLPLFYAILRSFPDVVLANQQSWSLFRCCTEQYISTEPAMVAQSIERLLFGRKSYMQDMVLTTSTSVVTIEDIIDFTLPILEHYIIGQDISDHVQGLACNAVACLSANDWKMIVELPSDSSLYIRIMIVIRTILKDCTDTSKASTLQESSCKAIGNIGTNCVPSILAVQNQSAIELVVSFFTTFKETLLRQEYTNPVRCMAMFAIGNVSHAIVTTTVTSMDMIGVLYSDLELLFSLAELCHSAMSNSHEKLATNAVRTTGYITGLILGYNQRLENNDCYKSRAITLLQQVLTEYVNNIRSAVKLETSPNAFTSTWKQRAAMKKQGWGSCNALSFLLERNVLTHLCSTPHDWNIDSTLGKEAVSCLVDCIEHADSVNEKILVSALVALRSISDMSTLDDCDHLFGRVMVVCCTFLFVNESNVEPKRKQILVEIELLLLFLTTRFTIQIVQEALRLESIVSTLPSLFIWMVKHNCSPTSFECIALAMAASGSHSNVEVEQQYMNHFRRHRINIQNECIDEL